MFNSLFNFLSFLIRYNFNAKSTDIWISQYLARSFASWPVEVNICREQGPKGETGDHVPQGNQGPKGETGKEV